MNEEQWVQHKSGHGPKWCVVAETYLSYIVQEPTSKEPPYRVPKLDYGPCAKPEVWYNVTAWYIERLESGEPIVLRDGDRVVRHALGDGAALVIERAEL